MAATHGPRAWNAPPPAIAADVLPGNATVEETRSRVTNAPHYRVLHYRIKWPMGVKVRRPD